MSQEHQFLLWLAVFAFGIGAGAGLVYTLDDIRTEQYHLPWRQLNVAIGLNIITLITAIAGLFGLYILYGTLELTQIQTGTAQQELELSKRPWVFADIMLAKDLTYNVNGANITLRFVLHNIGNSPAAATWVNLVAFDMMFEGKSSPIDEQRKLCDPMRTYKPDPHAVGFTIFPGQIIQQDISTSISGKEINEVNAAILRLIKKPISNFRSRLYPMIVGCIDYQFEFAPGHHQTPFMYQLVVIKPEQPGAAFSLDAYTPYTIALLNLQPWVEAGSNAD
jgi:hypothetical protein